MLSTVWKIKPKLGFVLWKWMCIRDSSQFGFYKGFCVSVCIMPSVGNLYLFTSFFMWDWCQMDSEFWFSIFPQTGKKKGLFGQCISLNCPFDFHLQILLFIENVIQNIFTIFSHPNSSQLCFCSLLTRFLSPYEYNSRSFP